MQSFSVSTGSILDEKNISYFEEAQAFGIDTLEEPFQGYVIVYTAQGIIDNGGVRYLFENRFKAQYAYTDVYEMIINAYAAYGFVELSLMLKKVYVVYKTREKNVSLDLSDAHIDEIDELFFAYSDQVYKKLEKVEYYLEQHELTKKHILSVWGSEDMNGFKKIYSSTMIVLYPFIKVVNKKLWNTFYQPCPDDTDELCDESIPDIYQWQQATESVTWKEALELSGLQAYKDIDTQLHYTSKQIFDGIENPFCGEWPLSLLARIYEALLSFGYTDVYLTDELGFSYRIVDINAIKHMDILYWHGGILTPDYRFYFATGPNAYNGVLCGDKEDVLDMLKMANLEGYWMEEKEAH